MVSLEPSLGNAQFVFECLRINSRVVGACDRLNPIRPIGIQPYTDLTNPAQMINGQEELIHVISGQRFMTSSNRHSVPNCFNVVCIR